MKNLFGIELGNEEKAESYGECELFIIRRVESELSEKQDEIGEELEEQGKKASLPMWLDIVKMICFAVFMITAVAIVRAWGEIGAKAFTNAPWLTAAALVCGAAALAIWLMERNKNKTVAESEELKDYIAEAEKIHAESLASLGVPVDAKHTDVFSYPYKFKNGKEKRYSDFFDYLNNEWHVFREGDMLCFADCGAVIAIPTDDILGIYKVNKRVKFCGWNKETEFNKGEYKQYKITNDNGGVLYIKPCYALRFRSFGEDYEFIFPAYELETFTSLTGAPVKEEV
ncbi:MAG: hypothetical protein IJX27_02885 [Clostridia bacterium]|nr:hypothetical protein [Clostridia bacterium]